MVSRPIDRRAALAMLAGMAGLFAVGCSAGSSSPESFSRLNCTKEKPVKKLLLVAYGSWCGSTGEVAKAVGDALCAAGHEVDVLPARDVKRVDGYAGAVLGTAVRAGSIRGEVKSLARRAASLPMAYVVVCMTMKEDTPENRAKSAAFLDPSAKVKEPVSTGLFAGAMDVAKLNGFFRWMASKDKSGAFKSEDCRDWDKVRTWAGEVAAALA